MILNKDDQKGTRLICNNTKSQAERLHSRWLMGAFKLSQARCTLLSGQDVEHLGRAIERAGGEKGPTAQTTHNTVSYISYPNSGIGI